MRTIRVTGKGAVGVRPDMTRLDIRVAGVCPEYSKALERSTQDAEALRAAFGAIGFQKTDLKTTGFGVRAQ
ncbi:MAG: SIMPL domain-containing protein, partial [Clostridia bacterium]|nr:SIMPL domain-containing protein [Clostridia bacterium]